MSISHKNNLEKSSWQRVKAENILARKLHPDHNTDEEAHDQFQEMKLAYETLKDPHQKYMYDTGISVAPEDITEMHEANIQGGRKYYENRWYRYEKAKYPDQRDEYYETRNNYKEDSMLSI
jgi:DnaJ-class molecular chaperone